MSRAPLAGVRVVDLTSYIAGSYGAMMLADMGATVIKVEALEGDSFRELPGFFGWNRGKRSIAMNLKDPDGRAVVHRLAVGADVVMENMRPGVVERLGVDYATLRALNPRLIYSSVTAFGPDGPYRDRPGFDPLLQAMGGVMAAQGFGGPPQYSRIAPTDYYTAALACQAILAALFVRERTGKGQRVETSLLQGVIALQAGTFVDYPARETVYRETPTYRMYQAGDGGWLFLACGNQSFWTKLCKALGREDFADDPRFGSWLARRDNADALTPLLEAAFQSKSRDEWLRILADHDIPAAGTQTLRDFMHDPAVLHHKMAVTYEHPGGRAAHPDGPAPALLGVARARRGAAADARPAHRGDPARGRLCRRRHRRPRPPPRGRRKGSPRMTYETVLVDRQDHVVTITLNRPAALNAQNNPMRRELFGVFADLRQDEDVRAIVVTGAGERAFSAGADIKEFLEPPVPTRFREQRKRLDYRGEMDRCPQPIIAAIRGFALGGGLELALACDIRIAAEDAQLGLTEVNLAIIPGGGGTQRLPRVVGRGKALEMILTGVRVPADGGAAHRAGGARGARRRADARGAGPRPRPWPTRRRSPCATRRRRW